MNTNEVFGTSLRLLQHIENLVVRSVVDERSKQLILILIDQLRNEITVRIQAFKNRIELMQRMKKNELTGPNGITPDSSAELMPNYNRIGQRRGSIERKTNLTFVDRRESNVRCKIPDYKRSTGINKKTDDQRKLENLNQFNKAMEQRIFVVRDHMKALKNAFNASNDISQLTEKMAALKISDDFEES